MDTQKKIVSLVVIIGIVFCLYFYGLIFASSMRFETNKSLLVGGLSENKNAKSILKESIPDFDATWFERAVAHNPAETELYLRSRLLEKRSLSFVEVKELKKMYSRLLKNKPTWPYYFSGLAQLSMVDDRLNVRNLEATIRYGVHERKVIKSLAEILFFYWDFLEIKERNMLLAYLSVQSDSTISGVVAISAKFARIYEYCDFLYEKKHVEYAACKMQYWQPLSEH